MVSQDLSLKLIEEDGEALPGFAFFHIPLDEFLTMYKESPVYGHKNEEICCSSVNTGLFSEFKEMNNV